MTIDERIRISFFVSYAHLDDEYADPFMKGLKEMLAPSRKYKFEFWQDQNILPGDHWANAISNALKQCTLGLLLVSPAFLGSEFITKIELPAFLEDASKPVIPIMLRKVNFRRHDLKGLAAKQIFRFKAGPDNYRSYAQCGDSQRSDFVYDLHEQIESSLDKNYI